MFMQKHELTHSTAHMWRLEDNQPVGVDSLSFHHVGLEDGTQVLCLAVGVFACRAIHGSLELLSSLMAFQTVAHKGLHG